ncbi:MAG: chemotaxis response regulator protein-glutamate methylesterase [Thermodesulfobacteriota bacterium]
MARKIRVLVVDDSAAVRQAMCEILDAEEDITVIGTAPDPYFAAARMERELPDVITLDIEMPRMDGLTFLRKLMRQRPLPVVICSSLVEDGAATTLKALEYGAVEIIHKPRIGARRFIRESRIRICDAVRAAATANLKALNPVAAESEPARPAQASLARAAVPIPAAGSTEPVVVMGASTGGTEALFTILKAMPEDCPGIVIVQHMPRGFTRAFANRLNDTLRIGVKEAENGDRVQRGLALIAPGDRHLLLKNLGGVVLVEVKDGPLVCRHRPSVDVLFQSASRYAGKSAIGVLLTGMGDDGARGLLELKQAGAVTIAQDEASCVVFGMPRAAISLGAAKLVVPLHQIAAHLLG